jgi:hypothetical protein
VYHVPAFGVYVPINQDKQGYNLSDGGPMSSGLSFYFACLTEFDRVNSIEASRRRREVEV